MTTDRTDTAARGTDTRAGGKAKNKYRCLVLDHDDTAVKSSPDLHYPAFLEIMKVMRPEVPVFSYEKFIEAVFDRGFTEFVKHDLGFTDEEISREYEMWREFTKDIIPGFYDGFIDIVKRFRDEGGLITVVSHSTSEEIIRHYSLHGIVPDMIFGWEQPHEKRKPFPYPLERIILEFELQPYEILVLDDLKLGCDMAHACGVECAAAGWSHGNIKSIEEYMRKHCDYYFATVAEFGEFLFGSEKQSGQFGKWKKDSL